jgi:hypothetical protein
MFSLATRVFKQTNAMSHNACSKLTTFPNSLCFVCKKSQASLVYLPVNLNHEGI